ncbi:protein of unknown function DUF1622 [Niastella koreensis GR20-10]|uniref:DUF1622 domain-containing protein n=2 Tax=Niastella koreensis TaxID=354356 RepID=G8TRB7_NIAKG|nr:DUF1622 domain-containing protein [Niastella koreensis]AEW00039.1 protein of unknown function DUF1622 [Niastella koreensis GR20-10]
MRELTENMRGGLDAWGELTEVILNGISLMCIITGVVISLRRAIQERRRNPGAHPMHTYFRKVFGGWLVVALEIQLAADIVGTIVSPTSGHLIELGAIAVIRTFLNYFLSKELKEETEYGKGLLAQKPERSVV